jgi:tRNA(fMet)-specific endonuclease VapC
MIMLDSNVVIAILGDRSPIVRKRFKTANAQGRIAVSSVVVFELEYGIAKSSRKSANADALRTMLGNSLDVVAFDDQDALVSGEIRAKLESLGTPIGSYDVMIAGHALRHGATLVTANIREFSRVDGLKLENWAAGTP